MFDCWYPERDSKKKASKKTEEAGRRILFSLSLFLQCNCILTSQ
jgi:hypothetical protein